MAADWLTELGAINSQLRTYLVHRVGTPSDVDDILQQTAVELASRSMPIDPAHVRGLIVTIVRRRLFDQLRASYRQRLNVEELTPIASPNETQRLEARELLHRMADLLESLGVEERELIARTWEGPHPFDAPLSEQQRQQLTRLRARLKEAMEKGAKR